jgi:hypothetical protein
MELGPSEHVNDQNREPGGRVVGPDTGAHGRLLMATPQDSLSRAQDCTARVKIA